MINLLHIEDREDDRILVAEILRCTGRVVAIRYAMTEFELRENLRLSKPDLVICDHQLPGLDAPRAYEILRADGVDAPVILFSAMECDTSLQALGNRPDCTLIYKEDLWQLQECLNMLRL